MAWSLGKQPADVDRVSRVVSAMTSDGYQFRAKMIVQLGAAVGEATAEKTADLLAVAFRLVVSELTSGGGLPVDELTLATRVRRRVGSRASLSSVRLQALHLVGLQTPSGTMLSPVQAVAQGLSPSTPPMSSHPPRASQPTRRYPLAPSGVQVRPGRAMTSLAAPLGVRTVSTQPPTVSAPLASGIAPRNVPVHSHAGAPSVDARSRFEGPARSQPMMRRSSQAYQNLDEALTRTIKDGIDRLLLAAFASIPFGTQRRQELLVGQLDPTAKAQLSRAAAVACCFVVYTELDGRGFGSNVAIETVQRVGKRVIVDGGIPVAELSQVFATRAPATEFARAASAVLRLPDEGSALIGLAEVLIELITQDVTAHLVSPIATTAGAAVAC